MFICFFFGIIPFETPQSHTFQSIRGYFPVLPVYLGAPNRYPGPEGAPPHFSRSGTEGIIDRNTSFAFRSIRSGKMQATIASQFAPVAARANATSSRVSQRVPGVCRIRAAAPATRVAAPVAGAPSLAIGSTFAANRALNVAVARQVTLKPQPARGVVRCNAQAAAEGER